MTNPGDILKPVSTGFTVARVIELIKDNQMVTALLVVLAWQFGFLAQVAGYAGGVC